MLDRILHQFVDHQRQAAGLFRRQDNRFRLKNFPNFKVGFRHALNDQIKDITSHLRHIDHFFVLLGQKAQELEGSISDAHYILKASHPASAAYSGGEWDCKDVFNESNRIIKANNGPEFTIQW